MCPLWPFHYVILYVLLFLSIHFVVLTASRNLGAANNVILNLPAVNILRMSETNTINITISNALISNLEYIRIDIKPNRENVVIFSPAVLEVNKTDYFNNETRSFNVTGDFLGSTNLLIKLSTKSTFLVIQQLFSLVRLVC